MGKEKKEKVLVSFTPEERKVFAEGSLDFERVNGKVVFVFPANDIVYKLIAKYNEGAMVDAERFDLVVRKLESQVESSRNRIGLWDPD